MYTKEQVINILQYLLQEKVMLLDAIKNEDSDFDAATLVDVAELYTSENTTIKTA